MEYFKLKEYVTDKMSSSLPAYLTYHSLRHTENVIAAAEELAEAENVHGDDLIILKTAALFHDLGYIQDYYRHEETSCHYARRILPDFNYKSDQINLVCDLILSTRIPQTPTNFLAEILCDADLFYLGTTEYESRAAALFEENQRTQDLKSETEWLLTQVDFLNHHRYFTPTAQRVLNKQKEFNLLQLKERLTKSMNVASEKRNGNVLDYLLLIAGSFIAAVALKLFMVPNHFFDGGITGISLLVHEIRQFNLAITISVLNLPFIIASYFIIGAKFAIRAAISILLLGVFLTIIPNYAITADKLLISIFGGVCLGIGVGLAMRAGTAIDGIEVLALYTLKRTSFTISEIIMAINIMIFSLAAIFFGIETALYSILTYFCATRSIDYVVEGLQAYTGVTIVSSKSELIKHQLVNKMGKGITVYKGERGFLPGRFNISAEADIIFTVITRLEFRKLENLVFDADPQAFMFASTIKDASGGILRRRKRH